MSIKVAYFTAGATEYRGGPLLILNFAKAVKLFGLGNADIKVFTFEDIELYSSRLSKLANLLVDYKNMIDIVPIKIKYWNTRKDLSLIPKLFLGNLDSGVEGVIDLFYFLVSHKYIADPFHLTYYIKEVLNDSDVVHIGHWISDYSLMIRTLRVRNKIPANTRILCHALIHPISIKSEVRYLSKGVVYGKINAIRHILSSYDAITVSTPYELQLLKLLGLNNVYLVGETIDTDFLRKNESAINELANKIRSEIGGDLIVFIGPRSRRKGYLNLLRAFVKFVKQFPYTTLVSIGEASSSEKELIEKYENALLQSKRLKIYRFLPSLHKYAFIKASDLLVLPSKEETIPLVFLEAWSMKKPVIGAKSPTISSVIRYDGDGGILVDPDNVDELERALYSMLSEGKRTAYGYRGYEKFISRYSMEVVGKKLSRIYCEMTMI
jgi:glycosyltransferase involved in cell wall biosynthesis